MDRAVTNEAETNEAAANQVAAKQALANEALANEAALPEIVAPRSDAPSEPLALRLLDPSEVRARRRPVALGLYVAYQMATGLLVALPVHAWAKAVWGAHPDGDAVLFRPGARDLLAWIGGTSVTLDVVGRTTLALGALIVLMHPLPLGLLLAALATGRDVLGIAPRPRALVRAAAPMFAPLLLVFVIASLAQLCVLGLGFAAGGFFESSLTAWLGERPALLARVAMLLPFVFAASVFGVEADVARAYVADRDRRAGAPLVGQRARRDRRRGPTRPAGSRVGVRRVELASGLRRGVRRARRPRVERARRKGWPRARGALRRASRRRRGTRGAPSFMARRGASPSRDVAMNEAFENATIAAANPSREGPRRERGRTTATPRTTRWPCRPARTDAPCAPSCDRAS